MREDNPEDSKFIKQKFDGNSKIYDYSENTLEGRLQRELEWERILKSLLPENRGVRILDAGGGTGRITLPLAKLGYQVTLCDLSPGMLDVARGKLLEEALIDRVEIREADLASMPFSDEVFDLVVCLHGAFCNADSLVAAKELTRVLKRRGVIMVDTLSRYWAATNVLSSSPDLSLKLLKSERNHAYDVHGDWQRVFSPDEFKKLFDQNGIKNIKIYGSFYQLPELFPKEILENKQKWDEAFISQLAEAMMCLSISPSVIGMARELILVGEKI
jgi:ubiquinone/menaquinone biosynthesis C-methylase UbiE